MARAVAAARAAFDDGPWPRLTHAERAEYLRALGAALAGARRRAGAALAARVGRARTRWRSTPAHRRARHASTYYAGARRHVPVRGAGRADRRAASSGCSSASRSAWSARSSRGTRRVALICHKIGPALLAGCTVVLKSSPEAPGRGLRVRGGRRADRPAAGRAQRRHRRPRGLRAARARSAASTRSRSPARPPPAGGSRRSAASASPAARSSSAASRRRSILDDMDLATAAATLAEAECVLTGQVCSSLTRDRRDPAAATTSWSRRWPRSFAQVQRRRPVRRADADGPARRRAPARPGRGLHRQGRRRGRDARDRRRPSRRTSTAATSSSRPCSATSTTARRSPQEEIFGPVLSVIPADDEQRRGPDRERHDLRAQRVGVHERRRPGPRRSPASCAPARSATTRSAPTSAWRSAGSSSRASAARAARKVCCRSSRPRP